MMDPDTDFTGRTLTRDEALAFVRSVTPDQVVSVYSGRIGCMCGCRGKHRYNPALKDAASKDRGYEVSDDECSKRSVSITLHKLQKCPLVGLDSGYILHYRDDESGRQYAAYVRKDLALGRKVTDEN